MSRSSLSIGPSIIYRPKAQGELTIQILYRDQESEERLHCCRPNVTVQPVYRTIYYIQAKGTGRVNHTDSIQGPGIRGEVSLLQAKCHGPACLEPYTLTIQANGTGGVDRIDSMQGPEAEFVNVQGAQELIPRNQFRQALNRFLGSLKGLQIRDQGNS
jgi:hypothetical protein